jgi:hypothetical protein
MFGCGVFLMSDDLAPAIAVFERIIAEAERKAADARNAINALYKERGLPARYADDRGAQGEAGPVGSPAPTQIKRDSFYGKKQMTAIRELLEMRRANGQGEGPATPREVVNGLKAGGYRFETKTDDIALINVRALMRKATNVFHKLPGTNAYGLVAWYPNAKLSKAGDAEPEGSRSTAASRRGKGNARKPKITGTRVKTKRAAASQSQKSTNSTFVENALADGAEWTTDRLLEYATSKGITGVTRKMFHTTLIALLHRKRVTSLGNGVWKIAPPTETAPDDDRVVRIKGFA